MAANGYTIQAYFRRILEAALPNIREYNDFVSKEAVRKPDLIDFELEYDESGNVVDASRIGEIRNRIAQQFFQSPEDLETWLGALSSRYHRQSVVQEAVKRLRQEQQKPPLWAVTDESDSDQFIFENAFLSKTLSSRLKSRYRLDIFEPLISTRDSAQDWAQDERDFKQAKCIVVSRSLGDDSPAAGLINNIVDLALAAHEGNEAAPRIIFTAATSEQALALQVDVTNRWVFPGSLPFLFLIPSDDPKEIVRQREIAKKFLTLEDGDDPGPNGDGHGTEGETNGIVVVDPIPPPATPPSPTENDLVVLIGGKLNKTNDATRFEQLTKLLGENDRLVIVQPWSEGGDAIQWNSELERKLGAAARPMLIEYVGEDHEPTAEVAVFFQYLFRSAATRSADIDILSRLQSMQASIAKQRMIWNPSGAKIKAPPGAEVTGVEPDKFALLIQHRLGLTQGGATFPAFVAVEEVIVDQKTDSKLQRALQHHLSIVVGGDGKPPTDYIVPFSFRIMPDKDPLHLAVESFLPWAPNIVAACDASAGTRPLKQYLTEINARVRDGLNTYFKDKEGPVPDCLRIVVMVDRPKQLAAIFTDNAEGSWRVIKFKRTADAYEPDANDIEGAKAWVNEQMSERNGRDPQNPEPD